MNRPSRDPEEMYLEPLLEDALRSAPLAPPPPLLYAAIMKQVRQAAAPPPFRVSWLDLAISLFGAGMAGLVWLVWRWLPPIWVRYMQMELQWQLQKLWYLDADWLLWAGVGLAALLAGVAAALWSCARDGTCASPLNRSL